MTDALVLVAVFLFPVEWADVSGEPGPVRYEDAQRSEFWEFFHVQEIGRDGRSIRLRTGGFTEHIRLEVGLDKQDRVVRAELRLRRSWALGPPFGINPFALDVAKSFLVPFAPEQDQDWLVEVAAALRDLPDQETTRTRFADPEFAASPAARVLLAYLDDDQPATILFDLGRLAVKHEEDDNGETWLALQILLT